MKIILPSLAVLGLVSSASAQSTILTDLFDKERLDEAWALATLYDNKANPVIQKLAFTGRLQYDYAFVDGDGVIGAGEEEIDLTELGLRRLRAGFKATFFKDFTAHIEGDFDYEADPIYLRLTDAYIGWKYSDAFGIKVGKQGASYTLDGSTSSKELITIDRNNLTNNLWFTNEYIPGISASGKVNEWSYNVGLFSQGGEDQEFGDFDGGSMWLASVGYDFSKATGLDVATVTLDYVVNEETTATSGDPLFTNRSLSDIASLHFQVEQGKFGLRGDIAIASGYDKQSDLKGIMLMPYYNFTDKLQGVLSYTYIESDEADGVRLARYESLAMDSKRGDQYQEFYAGVNYYLYGHKLKWQTGIQYVDMQDKANNGGEYDGWGITTGLRLSW
jgi:phosphate-selective porin OprO and OprP